jgi:polyhydroxybutyrate depolymerase
MDPFRNALAGWPFGLLLLAACGSTSARASGTDHPDGGQAETQFGADAGSSVDPDAGSASDTDDGGNVVVDGDSGNADGSDAGTSGSEGGPDGSMCRSQPSSTASQPGYAGDWVAGDYPSDFVSGGNYLTISGVVGQMGNTRQYAVHVPTGYDAKTAVPALFCIHGLGQTASMFCLDTGVAWPTKADAEGFVVIMPNGYMNSWNGGTCCGAAASSALDDVALMRAIFTEVGKHVNIDLGRVYATGLSNGAYLSYRLACEASDLFVAVASSAGAIGTAAIGGGTQSTSDLAACTPTNKVSILDIHGTADPLIPYATQKPSLAMLQASYGCSTSTVPATVPASGGDTTCQTFSGCPTCPEVEVTGCSITGGGHCWFGSSDCGTGGGAIGNAVVGNNSTFMKNTDAIWAFLSRLSR